MKVTLHLIVLLLFSAMTAQQVDWVTLPGYIPTSNISGLGYAVTSDPSGNVIIAGYKEQPYNYNEVFGTVAITKYNSIADIQWSKTIGGHSIIYALETDTAGNILVAAGYITSMSIGDFGLISISEGVQFVALKFDSLGNLLWYHELGDGNPFMSGFRCITSDSLNNVYIGYDDYNDSWIRKLSPSGETLQTIIQTGVPMLSSISVDELGNIHVAGSCANPNSVFGSTPAPTTLPYSVYLVRYSADGTYQWHHYVQDITCERPRVIAHSSNEIYLCAQLFDAFPIGSITPQGPAGGYVDFFLAKLNGSGTFQWVREVPGFTGGAHIGHRNFLDTDAAGNIYFAGSYRGTIEWSANAVSVSINFQDDALLLIYNNNGTVIHAQGFGGNQQDRCDGIVVSDSGIYISGLVYGEAAFGSLTANGGEQYYPFLTKLSALPLQVSDLNPISVKLYPNPTSDRLHLSSAEQVSADLYNLQGQKIRQLSIGGNTTADISDLQSGIYIVDISGQKLKFIKTK